MKNLINILIDENSSCFILTGNTREILHNRRLLFSFKRLRLTIEDKKIYIPYEKKTQISTLQEIQELLKKFNFIEELSKETIKNINSFNREIETFKVFSQKARMIRSDEFKDNPKLVKEFEDFLKVLNEKMVRELYYLQKLSAFHMSFSQNACNFSVPGSGKTSIVYGAYAYLNNLPKDDIRFVEKLLIIGPISSFAPWENEYKECFGRKATVQRLSGDSSIPRNKKEQHLYSGNPAEITLIFHGGVDSLQKEIIDFLKSNKTMVVVDEAHRIKNPEGVWGKSVVDIAKEARSRIILTGTPVPNGYEDLFNLFQFIYPYKFKDILQFHYGNLVDMTKNSHPDSERVKEFTNNITPYFIRIKKSDLNLPPISEQIINIEMDDYQREIYDFIETKYVKSFQHNNSATIKDVLNKAKLIRLRQAATNPSLLIKPIYETLEKYDFEERINLSGYLPNEFIDDSEILSKICNYSKIAIPQKFIEIETILSNILKDNEKCIIWTIFVLNAKELKKFLLKKNFKSELLIGEVEQADRELIIEKFNNPENFDFQVVIANPFSISESISLHKGCHNAIYMERDYNCSNFLQSKDRIHRVGLSDNQITNYYYILSNNSIDNVINDRLIQKVKRMEHIIDEDIPLFSHVDDSDETDLIKALLEDYARRT